MRRMWYVLTRECVQVLAERGTRAKVMDMTGKVFVVSMFFLRLKP